MLCLKRHLPCVLPPAAVASAQPDYVRYTAAWPAAAAAEGTPPLPQPAPGLQLASSGDPATVLARQPNDAMFADYAAQWHLLRISAPAAWEVATGSRQVGSLAAGLGALRDRPL